MIYGYVCVHIPDTKEYWNMFGHFIGNNYNVLIDIKLKNILFTEDEFEWAQIVLDENNITYTTRNIDWSVEAYE